MIGFVLQLFQFTAALLKTRAGLQAENLGIEEVLTAPRCPWQNPYSERLNGSIRREYLDHVIILSEDHLRRVLKNYFDYYNRYRVHQSLEMDAPEGRNTHAIGKGNVFAIRHLGGLHHHYERRAA